MPLLTVCSDPAKPGRVALSKHRIQSRWLLWNPTLQKTTGWVPGKNSRCNYTATVSAVGFAAQQLPQHILQNPAVGVVERFLRRVDADQRVELDRVSCAVSAARTFTCASGGEFFDYVADAGDLEDFFAGQLERFGGLSGAKLQRQNSHADQVRAVNAFVAFGDDGANSQQARAFRRPVARGAGAVFFAGKNDERRAVRDDIFPRRRRSTSPDWSGRWRVNPPSTLTSLLRRRTLANVPRTMTS